MALRTSVEVEAGAPVVRQVADGHDVGRLQRRAAGLAAAAGPGVVAVVRSGATADGGWELVTAHAGLPLDAARIDGPDGLATIGARVADTLARLHASGLVHGQLEVEHIAIGVDGAPVLCGIEPSDRPPSDDVAALGRILLQLASDLPAAERLETIAACAGDEDPDRRPTARRLAADLAAIVRPHPAQSVRAVPTRWIGAASLLVALVVVVALRGGGSAAAPETASPTAATGSLSTSSTAPDPASESTLPACVASAARPVSRSDACPSQITVVAGAVEVDGVQLVVGRPGDQVLVGDWACEGLRAALLRPATGEVLVFAAVEVGGSPEVVQAERIEGATGLAARTEPDGCASLLVLTDAAPIRLT